MLMNLPGPMGCVLHAPAQLCAVLKLHELERAMDYSSYE